MNMNTEESRLLALLLLRNSLYWHRNLWSCFYGSTFFVNHFLTTGPRITWTFSLLDTEFQAQSPCYVDLNFVLAKRLVNLADGLTTDQFKNNDPCRS
jgi:hypothetical protein